MFADFIAMVSFVLITTFTPGPNNITSASMGILYGYKKTVGFLLGIATGHFMVMLLSGWASKTIFVYVPSFEGILRIVGAVYILYLAWHTMKASYSFDEEEQRLFGFAKGFLLQWVNPKGIFYGLTLYSTFLIGVAISPVSRVLSALVLAIIGFAAISTWTLFGAAIRTYLKHQRVKVFINLALSLLLVYTAVEISGLLEII